VAFGRPFVVAGAAAVSGDQARVRSPIQRRGSTSKACASRLRTIFSWIFKLAAQVASLPAYLASAQASRTRVHQRDRFHSKGRSASRSWTEAAMITTVSTRPVASTAM
jgi:hypothetical protein